jgi:hypothetical protein
MKCPHRIEPHQIQGLDYIHIFPVIQWLVKKVIETRAEMGDYIRKFSESQFNKHLTLPQDAEAKARLPQAVDSLSTVKVRARRCRMWSCDDDEEEEENDDDDDDDVGECVCVCVCVCSYSVSASLQESYKARRRFRQPQAASTRLERERADEENRIQTTLLEYGHRYRIGREEQTEKKKKKKDDDGQDNKEAQEEVCWHSPRVLRCPHLPHGTQAARIAALMGTLSAAEEADLGDNWRDAVGVSGDAIKEMMDRYKELQSKMESADQSGLAAHKRQVGMLEKQLAAREKRKTEVCAPPAFPDACCLVCSQSLVDTQMEQAATDLQAQLDAMNEALRKATNANRRIDREMAKFDEMETEENKSVIAQLRALINMNEKLRQQEAEFKRSCRVRTTRLTRTV